MPSVKSPAVTRSVPAAPSKNAAGTGNEYKPSKDAASLNKNAANKNTTAENGAKANTSSSPWGGMLRNVGLLAGGMFLGGMLANLFGMGGGFMSDLLGIVANALIFAVILMLAMTIWRKITSSKKNKNEDNIKADREKQSQKIIDIQPSSHNSYERRSKADEYRNR
ncbi:hypothetical protein [Pectinatus haikarae]|uniref:Lipid-binding transport protein (Tim44 family) n=2 Tax=Pectinatus haikarae TaxID=349096 RepID=A0ABT9Y7Q8_9FIRM|nr:hypothetical protein [Pectinatus haikarae]MDQ0203872.1 putative lipid-binding transport protein (Tim44 family) [Pectinatus haikarae]